MNVLIAMMTTSYDKVFASAEAQAIMARGEAILRWETTQPYLKKKQFYEKVTARKGRKGYLTIKVKRIFYNFDK